MATTWTMRARRGALAALALSAAIGVATAAAPTPTGAATCTSSWKDPVDGDWSDDTKWSTGQAPLLGGHVCITVPGDYTVQGSAPEIGSGLGVNVDSVQLGATTGSGTQELVYHPGPNPTAFDTGDLDIAARGQLTFAAQTSGGSPYGLVLDAGQTLSNAGTISVPAFETGTSAVATIRGDVENLLGGDIRVAERLTLFDSSLTNDGTIDVDAPFEVQDQLLGRSGTVSGGVDPEDRVVATGTAIIDDIETLDTSGSQIAVDGGTLELTGDTNVGIDVRDLVTISGDLPPRARLNVETEGGWGANATFEGTWTNHGTVTLRTGSVSGPPSLDRVDEESMLVNEGTIEVQPGVTEAEPALIQHIPVENRGTIALGDDLDVWSDLRNEGTIDLGTATVDQTNGDQPVGDITLTPASTIAVEVAEPPLGTGFVTGRITSASPIVLGGTLAVTTTAVSAPAVGTQLPVVSAASRTSTFDDVTFGGPASYDAQYTATEARLVRRASESATRRFVRAAYQDFLGRQPTTTELGQRATAIDGGTLTRATLVRQLSLSTEYVTTLVQRFYADTLGRPGDPGGVDFWVGELTSGRKTVAEVAGSFYASQEYFTRAGGTNTAWVTDLYDVFFERPPTSGDLTYWTGRIASRGRTRVAIELFQSLESRRQRVQRLYQDLLGRDGDADGIDFWAARITTQGDLALAVNLAASAEYLDRAQTRYP